MYNIAVESFEGYKFVLYKKNKILFKREHYAKQQNTYGAPSGIVLTFWN